MQFETLADLLEGYENGDLPRTNPLIINRDEQIAYVERLDAGEDPEPATDEQYHFEDKYLFCLSLTDVTLEALEILGVSLEEV